MTNKILIASIAVFFCAMPASAEHVICTGVDDTAALQTALDAGPTKFVGNCVVCSLNAANRRPILHGVGPVYSNINPKPDCPEWATKKGHIIDFSGSYFVDLADFSVGWGAGNAVITQTAFAFMQTEPATSNLVRVNNVFVLGKFRSTTFYVYGVASGRVRDSEFYNFNPGADTLSSVVYMTGKNGWGLESNFATISTNVGIGAPQWQFSSNEIHNYPGVGGNAAAIWLDGADDVHFFGGVISAGGLAYVFVDGNVSHIIFHGVAFGQDGDPVIPASVFRVNSGNLADVSLLANHYTGNPPLYDGPGSHP